MGRVVRIEVVLDRDIREAEVSNFICQMHNDLVNVVDYAGFAMTDIRRGCRRSDGIQGGGVLTWTGGNCPFVVGDRIAFIDEYGVPTEGRVTRVNGMFCEVDRVDGKMGAGSFDAWIVTVSDCIDIRQI